MRGAFVIDKFAFGELQRPAIEAHGFTCWRFDIRRQRMRAPQNSVDARHEFARVEGFDDVIVGADFEADNAVEFLGAG